MATAAAARTHIHTHIVLSCSLSLKLVRRQALALNSAGGGAAREPPNMFCSRPDCAAALPASSAWRRSRAKWGTITGYYSCHVACSLPT